MMVTLALMVCLRKKILILILLIGFNLQFYSRESNEPVLLFLSAGFEQLHYGHFNAAFSVARTDDGYSFKMHTLHVSYSPWGRQSQLYYGFDFTTLKIGGSLNGGILTDYKKVSPFFRPELGINLAILRVMIGYNIPFNRNVPGNRPMLTFKIYVGLWLNRKSS